MKFVEVNPRDRRDKSSFKERLYILGRGLVEAQRRAKELYQRKPDKLLKRIALASGKFKRLGFDVYEQIQGDDPGSIWFVQADPDTNEEWLVKETDSDEEIVRNVVSEFMSQYKPIRIRAQDVANQFPGRGDEELERNPMEWVTESDEDEEKSEEEADEDEKLEDEDEEKNKDTEKEDELPFDISDIPGSERDAFNEVSEEFGEDDDISIDLSPEDKKVTVDFPPNKPTNTTPIPEDMKETEQVFNPEKPFNRKFNRPSEQEEPSPEVF